ncbi:polysaccharide deacetylase family protein [Oceanobacillus salinisoli]|uniref:polysaccharide deacetylase family protein n=1 Tax=Oceanobacillus salinisoli TaxID=2678611 RepID=UPI0018CC033F|nr:polysaccharide deacetylase family protein [Oceanobacillus salinisoli]
MPVEYLKLIELLDIEQTPEKSILRIRLSFEGNVELRWEIDNFTASNLQDIAEPNQSYQYRLSFQISWDPIKKRYVSYLSRTYLDHSDRVYFQCSEEYKKALNAIQSIQSIKSIDSLSFLSFNLLKNDETELESEQKQEIVVHNQYDRKFSWMAVTFVSVLSLILFSFSVHARNSVSNEEVIANAETQDNEFNINIKENMDLPLANSEKVASKQPIDETSIPYVELTDEVTYSIPDGNVALTFDDGPSIYSKEIVDILKKYQAGGTFFYIGLNVEKYPSYVEYVSSNGYSIGTHSMNHVDLSELSSDKQHQEHVQVTRLIEDILGEEVNLFRPPFGKMNQLTIDLINKHQDKMVLWNRDPKDWKSHNPDEIFNYIQNSNVSGSIILLHESQAVVDALPQILEHLQEQGLQVVSLK